MVEKVVATATPTAKNHHQSFDLSIDMHQQGGSKLFDDDGRLKRSGK